MPKLKSFHLKSAAGFTPLPKSRSRAPEPQGPAVLYWCSFLKSSQADRSSSREATSKKGPEGYK